MLLEAMDADDAMGSYDPWGTGKYRGINIEKEKPRGPEVVGGVGGSTVGREGETDAVGAVTFKKRKGSGNKGKFRRKDRDDEK